MKRLRVVCMILFFLSFGVTRVSALPMLDDWAFNINGALFTPSSASLSPGPGQLPDYVDYSGFNWTTGLGTITMTYNPAVPDNYFLISFFDHEFAEPGNSYFNEFGSASGTPAEGQSWEIDEPGYLFGDIRTYYLEEPPDSGNWVEYVGNVENGTLDNFNNVPEGLEDDVSMALGWDFSLASDETALINFILSEDIPADNFYLSQTDVDSNETIYFSSTLEIQGGPAPVPEPGTMVLLMTGLLGIFGFKRIWSKKTMIPGRRFGADC